MPVPRRKSSVAASTAAGSGLPARPASAGAAVQKAAGGGALVCAGQSAEWGVAYAGADGRAGFAGEAVSTTVAKIPQKKTFVRSIVERRTVVTTVTEI